jgi:hypothetical protein
MTEYFQVGRGAAPQHLQGFHTLFRVRCLPQVVCAPPAPATSLHAASPGASAVSLAIPITFPFPALGRFLPPQSAQAQLVRGQAKLQQREEAWSQESRMQHMVRRAHTPCWGRSCVGDATGGLAVRACRRLARSASRAASCTRCHACDVPAV